MLYGTTTFVVQIERMCYNLS